MHKVKYLMFWLLLSVTMLRAQEKPNIVLLFIDDWAWNGSSVLMDDQMENSKMPVLQMPNLDKLASESMKFRNAYAGAPQCAPSRVSLQTGKSSARSGFTVYLGTRFADGDLYRDPNYKNYPVITNISDQTIDKDALTIPEALSPLGYSNAHFGKWHMRGNPNDEGYEAHDGDTNNNPGNSKILEDPKLMFSTTEKSVKFMEEQVKLKKPFYLQISHYAMHAGAECLPETRAKYVNHPEVQAYYKKLGKTAETINRRHRDPATWLGMGDDLDGRIGAVLQKIKDLGIEDNTYVILTSDNGYRHYFLPNLTQPFHGAKWWVWQAGIRVPMLVKGPGIKAGSTANENVVNYDFLPTFVDWAGGDTAELKDIDGQSLASLLKGNEVNDEFKNRYLYFHYPHYRSAMPHSAIVSGTNKVIHFYDKPEIPMLFDLSGDEGEVKNLASEKSELHQKLYGEMMRYFKEVGARFPVPNPDFDESLYKRSKEYKKHILWGAFKGERELEEDEK